MNKNVIWLFLTFSLFILLIKSEYHADENKQRDRDIGDSILGEDISSKNKELKKEEGKDNSEGHKNLNNFEKKKQREHKTTNANRVDTITSENNENNEKNVNKGKEKDSRYENTTRDVLKKEETVNKYNKTKNIKKQTKEQTSNFHEPFKKESNGIVQNNKQNEIPSKVERNNEEILYMKRKGIEKKDYFEELYDLEVKKHEEILDNIFLRIMNKNNYDFLKILDEYSLKSNMSNEMYTALKDLIKQISNSNMMMYADKRRKFGEYKMVLKNNLKEDIFKKLFLLSLFRWYTNFKLTKLHSDTINYVFYLKNEKVHSHKYIFKLIIDLFNSEGFLFYMNLNKFPFLEILKYYSKYGFIINNKMRNNYPMNMYISETFHNFIYTYFVTYNSKILEKYQEFIKEEEWKYKMTIESIERNNKNLFQKVKRLNENLIIYKFEKEIISIEECIQKERELIIQSFKQFVQETLNYIYNNAYMEKLHLNKEYKKTNETIMKKTEEDTMMRNQRNISGKNFQKTIKEIERDYESKKDIEKKKNSRIIEKQKERDKYEEEDEHVAMLNETYNNLKNAETDNKFNNYILKNFDKVFNFYSQYKNVYENYKNIYELENGYIINNVTMKKIALLFDPTKVVFSELSQNASNKIVNFKEIYESLVTIINFEDTKNFYDGQLNCHTGFYGKKKPELNNQEQQIPPKMSLNRNEEIKEQPTKNYDDEYNFLETMLQGKTVDQHDFYNEIDLSQFTPAAVTMKDRIHDQLKLLQDKYVDRLKNESKCILAFLYLIGVNDNEGKLKFPHGFPRNIDKSIKLIKRGNGGLCNFLGGFLFHLNLPIFVNNTNVWLTTEINDEDFTEIKENAVNSFFYVYHKQKKGLKTPPFLSNESRLFSHKEDYTKSKIISYALGSTKDDFFSKLAFTNNILRLKEKNKMNLYFRDYFDFVFNNHSKDNKKLRIKGLSPFLTSCDFLLNNIVSTVVESLKVSNILENSVYREEISENNKNLIENNNEHTKSLFEYFLKLADNRNSYALAALGEIYFLGNENIGIERDEQKAFEYWKKAADQGDSISALSTGYAYLDDYKKFVKQKERIKGMTQEQLKKFVEEEMKKKGEQKEKKKKDKRKSKKQRKGNEKENKQKNEQNQKQWVQNNVVSSSNERYPSNATNNLLNEQNTEGQNVSQMNNSSDFSFFMNDGIVSTGLGINDASVNLQSSARSTEDTTSVDTPLATKKENIDHRNGIDEKTNINVNSNMTNNKEEVTEMYSESKNESGVKGNEEEEEEKEEDTSNEMVNEFIANLNEKTKKAFKNAEYYFHQSIKHNDDSVESVLAKYNIYKFGLGREKNIELAGYYLKRAADKGDNIAQMLLGHYYAGTDIGVIINDKEGTKMENLSKSYKYYEMSAQGGNLISLYNQSVLILKGINPQFKTFNMKCQKTLKHFHFVTLFNDRISLLTKMLKRYHEVNDYVGSLLLAMMLAELGEHTNNVNSSYLWRMKKNVMEDFLKKHDTVETSLKKFKRQVAQEREKEREKKRENEIKKEKIVKSKKIPSEDKTFLHFSDLRNDKHNKVSSFTEKKKIQKFYDVKKGKSVLALPLLRNCVNFLKQNIFFYVRYCNYLKKELLRNWSRNIYQKSKEAEGAKHHLELNRMNKSNNYDKKKKEQIEQEYYVPDFLSSFKQIELYEKYDKIIFSEISKETNVRKKIQIIEKIKSVLFEHFRKTEFLHCYFRPISYYQLNYEKEMEKMNDMYIQQKTSGDQTLEEEDKNKKKHNMHDENGKEKQEKESKYDNKKTKYENDAYVAFQEKILNEARKAEFDIYSVLLENDDLQELYSYEEKYNTSIFQEIQSFSKNSDVCKHYYDIYSSYYGYNKASMELVKKYNVGDEFTVKSKRKELQYLLKNVHLGSHESLFYMALFFERNKIDNLKNVLQIYVDLATDKHEVCNVIGILSILKVLFKKIMIDMNSLYKKNTLYIDDELKQYILSKSCIKEESIFKKRKIETQCINYRAFLNDRYIYSELSYWYIFKILYRWIVSFFKGVK